MKTWSVLLAALLLVQATSQAVPVMSEMTTLTELQAKKGLSEFDQDACLLNIPYRISKTYDVPINFEFHPDVCRRTDGTGRSPVEFRIEKGQPLKQTLDDAVDLSGGQIEYLIIHDQICTRPTRKSEDEILSDLDVRISIDLKENTLWEALTAIVRAVNRQKLTPYPLGISPIERDRARKVVRELAECREIDLSLHNVTAREAICAVFAASSLEIAYQYIFGLKYESLTIITYEDGWQRKTEEEMTPEEIEWWRHETGWVKGKWVPLGLEESPSGDEKP